jgi:glycine cleavage system H lipoate-binding protein/ABC-type phosphate transport system substrate-binding protein
MKTKAVFVICLLALICITIPAGIKAETKTKPTDQSSFTVYSTPALYDLASRWARDYSKANPGRNINVAKLPANEIAGHLSSGNDICFVSQELQSAGNHVSDFRVVLGREIIVPVISSKNPFLKEINKKGISREALAGSIGTPGKMKWGILLDNGNTTPVRYFILNDELIRSGVEDFLKTGKEQMKGIQCESKDALLSSLQNDPYAIGFCRLTDILQPNSENFSENIRLMPIDKNGNGSMDYMEDIYGNFQDFTRGVWIGKYPNSLTRNIYAAAPSLPSGKPELNFLTWILGSGQHVLNSSGYSDLVSNERQSQLYKLSSPQYNIAEAPEENNSIWKIIIIILMFVALISFVLDLVISRFRTGKSTATGLIQESLKSFDERNVTAPKGLYFDKTHTWAFMEADGTVKVGIDDFLQHVTGPITSIGMKKPGDRINKGDKLCIIIQKGKQLNIYAPVSGTIKSFNHLLSWNSTVINDSPYAEGWVYMIEPSNWVREIEFLSMCDKYKNWLNTEFGRLKDFLAASLQAHSPLQANLILQDGGVLKDHVLADLGPEIWEDFQTKFINTSR